MRHHGMISAPGSDYARRWGGMNSFPGSVFLQMAASVALSALAAYLVVIGDGASLGITGRRR